MLASTQIVTGQSTKMLISSLIIIEYFRDYKLSNRCFIILCLCVRYLVLLVENV